jgi:hypothetical protein
MPDSDWTLVTFGTAHSIYIKQANTNDACLAQITNLNNGQFA